MIPLSYHYWTEYFALRLSLDSRFAAFLLYLFHLFHGLQLRVLHERSADRYRRLCKAQCARVCGWYTDIERNVHSNAFRVWFLEFTISSASAQEFRTSKLRLRALSNLLLDQFKGQSSDLGSNCNFFEKSHTVGFVKSIHKYWKPCFPHFC